MGGYGSTRWGAHARRWTAEECLVLSIFDFLNRTLPPGIWRAQADWSGGLGWVKGSQLVYGYRYTLQWQDGAPLLWLQFRSARHPVRLQSTACYYGGARWWFTCPYCQRRVAKLYKPPGTPAFTCRHCYRITYASAQEAHQFDRLPGIGWASRRLDVAERLERVTKRYKRARGKRKQHWARQVWKAWSQW